MTEQPDGIDTYSQDLPDPVRAAERIRAYVSSFGDGLYDPGDGNPLYGRDLEALARGLDQWRRIAVRLALAGDGSYRRLSTSDRDMLETGLAAYRQEAWDRADRLADLTEDAAAQGSDR
jgi:hypothetical protein